MAYWLVKTEPGTYSWANLERDKQTVWDGVRNFQAKKNLKEMKKGDLVFIYHSGEGKSIVGLAKVVTESYPDPKDRAWTVVVLEVDQKLKKPVTLAEIKAQKALTKMVLVRNSRLSVQPLKDQEAEKVLQMSAG